jgi:hypothetical protein
LYAFGDAANVASGVYLKPTNLPGVFSYSQPNPDFDPTSASDAELAAAGFPPRPDSIEAPQAFSHWYRIVSGHHARIDTPNLLMTDVQHGPVANASTVAGASSKAASASATSTNWSGYVVQAPKGSFSSTSSYTSTEFVVPAVRQAFGACTGSWDYFSYWTGFDGFESADVLQAGVEANAYCSSGATSTAYYAWYEWYPYNETRISNLPVSPGDLMAVEVYYTTTAPHGHAFVDNMSTQQYVSIAFNPPTGVTFAGNTVEWVAEAPTVNGSQSTLSNYVGLLSESDYAFTANGTNVFPASVPAGMTSYSFTMVNAKSVPISYCALDAVNFAAEMAVSCYTEGPAY